MKPIAPRRETATGHRPLEKRPPTRNRIWAVLTALAIALSGIVSPAPAFAAGNKVNGIEVSGVYGIGKAWVGSYEKTTGQPTGLYAWCIQGNTSTMMALKSSSAVTRPEIAYLLYHYENKKFDGKSMKDTHAAIGYLIHSKYDIGSNGVSASARRAAYVNNTPKATKDLAAKMWTEATNYGGTSRVAMSLAKNGAKKAILKVSTRSAKDKRVGGYTMTATISGPATFVSDGKKTKTFTSKKDEISEYNINVTGAGTVKVSVTSQVAGTTVRHGLPKVASQQEFYFAAAPTTVKDDASLTYSKSNLTVQTTASVNAAGQHTDRIEVSGLAGTALTGKATLYYHGATRPAQSTTISGTQRGSQNVSATLNSSGKATINVPAITYTAFGCYTWVVEFAATAFTNAYKSAYGIPSETVCINPKPQIATTISQINVAGEGADARLQVRDTIVATGYMPNTDVTFTAQLYYQLARPTQVAATPGNANRIGQVTVSGRTNASGALTAVTPWIDIPAQYTEGHVTFVVSTPASGITPAYRSAYGIPAETRYFERPEVLPPTVRTEVSHAVAAPGDVLQEVLIVSDPELVLPGTPARITSYMWLFDEVPTVGSTINPATANLVETRETTINRPGRYPLDFTIPDNGAVVFTYSIEQADGNDDVYEPFTDHEVYAEEMTLVPWTPKIETQTSHQIAEPGAQITDKLIATGGKPGSTLPVTSGLYGSLDSKPIEAPTRPNGLPLTGTVITELTFDADGNAEAETAPIELPERGYFQWHETAPETENGLQAAWSAPWGVASETTLVPWQPKVTTQASTQHAMVGDTIYDTFEVTDLPPHQTADVVTSLWLAPDGEVVLDDEIPEGAEKLEEWTTQVTADANGVATGRTPDYVVTAPGAVVYTETITPRDGEPFLPWQSQWGIASETVKVARVTTQATPSAAVNSDYYDVAYVEGELPAGSWMVFELWRQADSEDIADDELITTTEAIDIDGPGEYTSPAVSSERTGPTYFVEKVFSPEDPDTPIHVGEPRLPNETTYVTDIVTEAVRYATVGEEFYDVAYVESALPAGSWMEFELWRQHPTSIDVRDDELITTTEAIDIDGPGRYQSPGVTSDEAGTTYFVEKVYTPNDPDTPLHVGKPRLPNESTIVVKVTTQATPVVAVGQPFSDTALVEGPVPAGSHLVFKYYRQADTEDIADDELLVTTDALPVDGPGEYTSPEITMDTPVKGYWREELFTPENPGTPIHVGDPRLPNETTNVIKVTTQATPVAHVGEAFTDTALVEGPVPAGSHLVFKYYRQADTEDIADDELLVTTDAVPVDGPGEYTSPEITINEEMTGYWREELFTPENPDTPVHVGDPRLPNETTEVVEDGDGGGTSRDDDGSGRDLPKTGADRVLQGIIAAGILLALGGAMLTIRRKQSRN